MIVKIDNYIDYRNRSKGILSMIKIDIKKH